VWVGAKEVAMRIPGITRRQLRVVPAALILCVLAFARAQAAPAATPPVLYAVTGAGGGTGCTGSASSLYTIDSTTAAATLVGPIMIGTTQVNHVVGLAVDPTTGTLYGFMNGQAADCTDFGQGTLLTIDKATGAATVVGSTGAAAIQSPGMTFDPFGTLYAWGECCNTVGDDLTVVDTTTGTTSKVGECSCSTFATGIASNSNGVMYLKSSGTLYRLNQFTGHRFDAVSLDATPSNMLAFGPSDVLYTGTRGSAGPSAFTLQTIDPATGDVTTVGTNSVQKIGALAWDLGTPTAPDVADLSLTKNVDVPSPENWDDQVVYTLTVSNGGAKDATGVEVTDVLPSGVSYVSDDGGGDYDSNTGVWTVGTVTNGNSATLHITAAVQPIASWTNDAEVTASDQYDSDSVPGSGEGDTFASNTLTPLAVPGIDASLSVDPKGKTKAGSKTKRFEVIVQNVGSQLINVSMAALTVEVNSSTNTITCPDPSKTSKIKPGKQHKFKCAFSPKTVGIVPGQDVTYSASIDLTGDGFPANDDATATVVAS
jgi:uncharacterized repeat protein (TIGR01451 family)